MSADIFFFIEHRRIEHYESIFSAGKQGLTALISCGGGAGRGSSSWGTRWA
jgi:hypothetical protein